ncbi:AMP-binding protein [Streptomyces sp. NPDC051133]|uniref:AMP-binding protein n=1 Tax=Streptomyces sp. NPDC051133 TaxID=3155521 RepID=UPI00341B1E0F
MSPVDLRTPGRPAPLRCRNDAAGAAARTLDGLFSRAARRRPRAVLVREGPHTLAYGTADDLSTRLGTALLRTGVQLGDPVLVHCADHRHALVAQLAVLKAGGVCVPVHADAPADRLREAASVSGADVVLCGLATQRAWAGDGGPRPLALDDPQAWRQIAAWPVDRSLPRSAPTEPAYLLPAPEDGARPAAHLVDHRAWYLAMAARSARTGPCGPLVTVVERPTGPAALSALWWVLGSAGTLHVQPDPAAVPGPGVLVCETGAYAGVLDVLATAPPGPRPRTVLLVGAPCPPALLTRHTELLPATALRAEFAPAGSVLPWAVSTHLSDGDAPADPGTLLTPAPGVRLSLRGVLGEIRRPGEVGEIRRPGEVGEVCARGRNLPFDVLGDTWQAGGGGPFLSSGYGGRWSPDGLLEILGRTPLAAAEPVRPGRLVTS